MSLRRHTTSTDLSQPTIADDQSDSAGDDNSVPQLNISPTAQQLDLPTSQCRFKGYGGLGQVN